MARVFTFTRSLVAVTADPDFYSKYAESRMKIKQERLGSNSRNLDVFEVTTDSSPRHQNRPTVSEGPRSNKSPVKLSQSQRQGQSRSQGQGQSQGQRQGQGQSQNQSLESEVSRDLSSNKENEQIELACPRKLRNNKVERARKRLLPKEINGQESPQPKRIKKDRPAVETANRSQSNDHDLQKTSTLPRRCKVDTGIACMICFLPMATMKGLSNHIQYHNDHGKYSCKICNVPFRSAALINQHTCNTSNSHKPRRVGCNFCLRRFKMKRTLQAHLFHYHGMFINHEAHGEAPDSAEPAQDAKNNAVGTPATLTSVIDSPKGMRQTTLREFIPSIKTQQEGCATPHRLFVSSIRQPIKSPERRSHGKALKFSRISDSCRSIQSYMNRTPSNQTHVNSDTTATLLNEQIKIESKEFIIDEGPLPNEICDRKETGNVDETFAREISSPRNRKRNTKLTDDQLRVTFNCKDLIVSLERCDKVPETLKPTVAVPECGLQQEESKETIENLEDVDQKCLKPNVGLKILSIPLVRVDYLMQPKLCKSETMEQEVSTVAKGVKRGKTFKCRVCKKCLASKENLREHIELCHVVYISSICKARYTTANKLLNHYRRQHMKMKQRTCCVCREEVERTKMAQHMSLHCLKFVQCCKSTLPVVDNDTDCTVYLKRNRCKPCGKRFWLKECLIQHQKVCHRTRRKATEVEKSNKDSETKEISKSVPSKENVSKMEENASKKESSPENAANFTYIRFSSRKSIVTKFFQILPSKRKPRNVLRRLKNTSKNTARRSTSITTSSTLVNHVRPISGVTCVRGYTANVAGSANERFPCSICRKQFRTLRNLCLHEEAYCRPATDRCDICGTTFCTKRLLNNHILATHVTNIANGYTFFCRFCRQGFSIRSDVSVHERHFHPNPTLVDLGVSLENAALLAVDTICVVCNLMFESYDNFLHHNMYYYSGQVFTCTFCDETFYGMFMLHHHNKLVHYHKQINVSYLYKCDICSEGFTHESHYHAHRFHVHLDAPSTRSYLSITQEHNYCSNNISTVTANAKQQVPIKTYRCNVCSLHFANQRDLSLHVMEYSLHGNYQCDKCDRKCSSAPILMKHRSLNHCGGDIGDSYKCRFCREVLTTSYSMMSHEKHFHGSNVSQGANTKSDTKCSRKRKNRKAVAQSRKEGNLVCVTCESTFTNDVQLKVHLLQYANIGPFSCDVCCRNFAEVTRLKAHKIKHIKQNRSASQHHCSICLEGFNSSANVKMHIMHLHRYETLPNTSTQAVQPNDSYVIRNLKKLVQAGNVDKRGSDIEYGAISCYDSLTMFVRNCQECNQLFNKLKSLAQHRLRFLSSRTYGCSDCGSKFPWLSGCSEHLYQHSRSYNTRCRWCTECKIEFLRPIDMWFHVIRDHDPRANRNGTRCIDAGTCASNSVKSNVNKRSLPVGGGSNVRIAPRDNDNSAGTLNVPSIGSDTFEKETYLVCLLCNLRWPSMARFVKHFNEIHVKMAFQRTSANGMVVLNCVLCNAIFSDNPSLTEHMQSTHHAYTIVDSIQSIESDSQVTVVSTSSVHDDSWARTSGGSCEHLSRQNVGNFQNVVTQGSNTEQVDPNSFADIIRRAFF